MDTYQRCIQFKNACIELKLPTINPNFLIVNYALRPYHNLNHIERCLQHLDDFNICYSDRCLLIVAIWFHDYIYDPQRKDNEIMSAISAYNMLGAWQVSVKANENARIIFELIMSTIYDGKDYYKNMSRLHYIIRECDLIGLTDDYEIFKATDLAIKQEFAHIDNSTYRLNRRNFLLDLIEQKPFEINSFNEKMSYNIRKLIEEKYS